ncbi:transposase [soil metagenome]
MQFRRRKNSIRNGAVLDIPSYYYMITLVTKFRNPIFGFIKDGQLIQSLHGETAKKYWEEIPKIYPCAELFEFIIMPDHIHGIILLKENAEKPKSIAHIIQYYKREVTKEIHLNDPNSSVNIWQRSFWARGFKGESKLKAYEQYIRRNPLAFAK